jgi:hypothetical protein
MRLWRAERGVDYINHKIILGVWVEDSAIVLDYELLGFHAYPGKVQGLCRTVPGLVLPQSLVDIRDWLRLRVACNLSCKIGDLAVLSGWEEGKCQTKVSRGIVGLLRLTKRSEQNDVIASFREQGVIIVGSKRSLF